MAPYTNGSLITDTREIAVTETWETQSDWDAAAGITGVEVVDGSVQLNEFVIPDGGVSRFPYEYDSSASTAVDLWGSNDGTINGATYSTNSKYGSLAMSFDGSNDDATVPLGSGFYGSAFSIATWAYPRTFSSNEVVINYGSRDLQIAYSNVTSSDAYELVVNGSSVVEGDGSTPIDGQYILFVVTYDGSTATFYINDSSQGTHSETINTSGTQTRLANYEGSNLGDYADVVLDNTDFYDKELSSSEVSNLYNTGEISG